MILRAVLFSLIASFGACGATASEIEFHRGDKGLDLITIEGDIAASDVEKFKRIALQSKSALVILESPGGALAPALEIGRAIQIAEFSTYVPDNTTCTSSCALIWAAGSKRLMSRTARIGFHASYRDRNGRQEEVGIANAMVGRYLTLLNLPAKTVMFATAASPTEIAWIKTDGSDASGIEFRYFDMGEQQESPSPPPIQTMPTSTVANQNSDYNVPQWYYVTKSNDGSLYYVRGEDVEKGRATSRSVRFWVKTDDQSNNTARHRSSMALYNLDCVAQTYKTEEFNLYAPNGNVNALGPEYKTNRVVPDTIFEAVANLVCSDELPAPDARDIE